MADSRYFKNRYIAIYHCKIIHI